MKDIDKKAKSGGNQIKHVKKAGLKEPIKVPLSVSNNVEYEQIMAKIDVLIKIPDDQLTQKQANELHRLAVMAQRYEKSIYNIKPPSTFEGVLEMKMFELKLNQGEMAKKMQVSNTKFSLIMSGKQKPDIYFLKTMNESLGIDGNYLLSVI